MKDICMKKIKLTLAVLIAFLMTGCYPSGGELLSNEDNEAISEQIEYIVSGNENLDINVTLAENVMEVPEINVKVMKWDNDVLKEMFLEGKEQLNHYEYPSDNFSDSNYNLYMDESENGDAYWLVYEDGRLTSETRAEFGRYGYGTLAVNLDRYDFGGYFNDESIGPFSKSDAVSMAETDLKKLGVTNYSLFNAYAITTDKANKYLNMNFGSEYEKWSTDNEIYILEYRQEYEDIPVTDKSAEGGEPSGHGSYFIGSRITVIVSKDGILSINGDNLFSPEYSAGKNLSLNCSPQKALSIAAEYYNNLALPGVNMQITDCELVYVPFEQISEREFTMIPMWKIEAVLDYNDGRLINSCDYLFIDAQTGEIPVW